jgi:putative transposase
VEIRKCLGSLEIPQVKCLSKKERDKVMRRVKRIEGVSQLQAARILGVAVNFCIGLKGNFTHKKDTSRVLF